ncbi:MAG: glycosyltransferase [Paludibacteraceae bacterium]
MKKLLQINSVVNFRSTGTIVENIGQTAIAQGWESYVAWGRVARPSKSELIRIGNKWDTIWQGVETRLLDRHSMGSRGATRRLISQIKDIKPDIIHLHNVHAYYINIEILFHFLGSVDIPLVWTFHDCWPVTGHCAHFELIGCEKWKTECYQCPLKKDYPASSFMDRSRKNYKLKKSLFNSVNNLTIVPVSNWLGSIVKASYLSTYPVQVINNGIDLNIFHPLYNAIDIRNKYNIGERFMMLGVATAWSNDKGLKEFIELSNCPEWKVVLIGVTDTIKKTLPDNILVLSRTENQQDLAAFYAAADVFVNPTYQDSFPTVNLEAMACGTPLITYRTGGSPESITDETGIVVEKGDIDELVLAINKIKENGKSFYTKACRQRAEQFYNKEDRYQDYVNLYESLLKKKSL